MFSLFFSIQITFSKVRAHSDLDSCAFFLFISNLHSVRSVWSICKFYLSVHLYACYRWQFEVHCIAKTCSFWPPSSSAFRASGMASRIWIAVHCDRNLKHRQRHKQPPTKELLLVTECFCLMRLAETQQKMKNKVQLNNQPASAYTEDCIKIVVCMQNHL